jgi:DNA-directed RNA polymerase subunit L
MATFKIVKNKKFDMETEFRNFPLTFVNALRRITLSEIPIVVLRDIEIITNTSQMPYEMLKHRTELLPINVMPGDSEIIKNASVELMMSPQKEPQIVTTDDFKVKDGRDGILMKDRDLGTPLLFLRLKANEGVHLKAKLSQEVGSQVCTVAMSYHVDPQRLKNDREVWIESKKDPREFDNFYYQKSYSIDEIGRPNWIDLSIESIGVLSSQDILKYALKNLKTKIEEWMKLAVDNISKDGSTYNIKLEGGHTIGALLQEIIYHSGIQFVSYDIPHPLRPQLILKFVAEEPEKVLKETLETFREFCEIVEKEL